MEVAVYKACAKKRKGGILHFDIIVPAETAFPAVLAYGSAFLRVRLPESMPVSSRDCRFCYTTETVPRWASQIAEQGYYIHESQGCH
ncbi:DUF2024 family protein [Chitinophaga oryzae]|uniref:DUF2024 family protein n=1 Tax=Chitinophaga oryzae TaxID=2725414 RepID=A0AAE6ZK20_9BACT|nr:DUF2024 family protein [Chitinophaga oryzae]QJB34671.1 DUF2024 family protein [Chitinophaga oryzae]QJB41189.1 DUF2024 family protein [Chitinophaga oryzae]